MIFSLTILWACGAHAIKTFVHRRVRVPQKQNCSIAAGGGGNLSPRNKIRRAFERVKQVAAADELRLPEIVAGRAGQILHRWRRKIDDKIVHRPQLWVNTGDEIIQTQIKRDIEIVITRKDRSERMVKITVRLS